MSIRENFFPDRFRSASRYYTTGRPHYPASLSQRVADLIGLEARSAVLDVGTGPGFLAIDFAAHAGRVTAVDPSLEMLAVAAENADRASVKLSFVHGSSYDLGDHLGLFRLATFGRSFHWTDREATLRTLDRLIEPGGAVGLFKLSSVPTPRAIPQGRPDA
jgi:ubiquinone/menaquinone biosynthesis C-methylase UbiE